MTISDEVIELELGCQPEAAISGAVLVQTEYSTFLTFNAIQTTSEGWSPDSVHAVVEFAHCIKSQFGYPNDEALPGHPLYSKGLIDYGIYEVKNSSWMARLQEQNRIRFPDFVFPPLRHFIFTFHDSTFECLAQDLTIQLTEEPYAETLMRISHRILAE